MTEAYQTGGTVSTGRSREVKETRVYVGPITAVVIENGVMYVYAMDTGTMLYATNLNRAGGEA